ncbi:pyruvate formate-lyase-activating protein [Cellulomonas sp. URHD0024]|uniref:pyruvate formate-lyase-activating protein n=1 Tax=Cellulomonas sp. URHD0024 TaxID=1302620 RepID=UPI0004050433|nr:pyruvate formate-lyase-activating protein [Cellulomonas sp. URHD0024]
MTSTLPSREPTVSLGLPRAHAGTAGLAEIDVDRSTRLTSIRTGELGSVHSWELVTAVDGPGTRMTVFLAGCPLRCLYCHNPDTMEMRRGTDVTADEILGRLSRYRTVLTATGGGLTVSGGEPLMQPAFTARLLRGAKALDLHTALDSSGFLGRHCTDEMLDDLDLVLLDVKSGLPDTYRRATGRELEPTLEFGRRLNDRGIAIWVRFVMVPGLTDAPSNVAAAADEIVAFGGAERVEVLPFHQMGRDKWAELGLEYQLEDTVPPTAEALEEVRATFRSRGLTVY